jgi:hypothetical protein
MIKDMKDAVDKLLLFILCEIGNHTGQLYLPPVKLVTDDSVVYIDDQVTVASPQLVNLVDVYNYIVWGKVLKK